MKSYDVFFGKMQLPLAPSQINISTRNKNTTIDLINDGEVNLLKGAGLKEISFSFVLPNQWYPFCSESQENFKPAEHYLDQLRAFKEKKKPFRLIICRNSPLSGRYHYTEMMVSLEEYEEEDNVDEGCDIKVSVSLMEYRDHGVKVVKKKKKKKKRRSSKAKKNSGKTYTIAAGDTLWKIAKKMLGDGDEKDSVYKKNRKAIEKAAKEHGRSSSGNGMHLYKGTKIKIP